MNSANRIGIRTTSASSSHTAGAVTEEQFRAAFEDPRSVSDVRVNSYKDLVSECQKQAAILENLNNDWTKRNKALQTLRALLKNDMGYYIAFAEQAYSLIGTALELSVKDLRSAVCREACITIAYYCEKLGSGFWRVIEAILPITMNLTQNSAKIMATSGQICNVFIAKYVHHPKILTLIVQFISYKAKEIRRMSIALVAIIINHWESNIIDKHTVELIQSIKSALSDADQEARATARLAFENLQNLYPAKADTLFQTLEPAKQRMLTDRSSTASSTHSITSERDNLPNPNRGLYSAQKQNAFLNKRSASDLNHSARRVNLVPPRIVRRPNAINVNLKTTTPQTSAPPKYLPITPVSRKIQQPLSTPVNNKIHQHNATDKVQKIIATLANSGENENDVENSLRQLCHMIHDGAVTQWEEFFNDIFFAIQQVITNPMNESMSLKMGALKAMKELCMAQPKRLLTKTELVLMNILNAHESDEAAVVRAAEECGTALAKALPTRTCINLLLTVIDDENSKYHQLSGAIKMLSSVITKLTPKEVENLLTDVVPRMTRCYENSQSMVRRASIICLVSISISIGIEKLKPFLNQSTFKLVEVYAARMTKKDHSY